MARNCLRVALVGLLFIGCAGFGDSGLNSLVEMEAEPAGENCEFGGIAVHSGLDSNKDGMLSPEEISSTEYICNGGGGGSASTLFSTEELDVGDANCPTGGFAVSMGLDTDGNGVLDGDEITDTEYLCNGLDGEDARPTGVLEGSYTITNSLDEYWLSSITAITGDLQISAPGLISLSLPALTSVGGHMHIEGNATLTSLSLPSLTSIVRSLRISSNGALTSLSGLNALTHVGGHLNIEENTTLTSLSLSEFYNLGGDLDIRNNAALASVSLPALNSIGDRLLIEDNAALCNSLAFDLLYHLFDHGWTGSYYITGNDDGC